MQWRIASLAGPATLRYTCGHMAPMTFGEMLRISIAMPILLVLSFLVLAQALERFFVYWVRMRLPTGVWERVRDRLEAGPRALAAARRDPSLLGAALAALLALETATPRSSSRPSGASPALVDGLEPPRVLRHGEPARSG